MHQHRPWARRALALAWLCGLTVSASYAAASPDELVYIGTFTFKPPVQTAGSEAPPQGIYGARLDVKTGHLTALGLAVELKRASFLLTHPTLPIIYSVAQSPEAGPDSDSVVIGFAVDFASGSLHPSSKVDASGRDATHMALDTASQTLLVANHGTANVTALPLQPDGTLGAVVSEQKDYGSGPTPRQKTAAAHSVAVDPTHHYVAVADFGADRVFLYRFDPAARALMPASMPYVQLPPGSGPRRALFHPNGRFLYVGNELTGEITCYRWNGHTGTAELVKSLSPYAADYAGEKSAAEIAISRDGRYFYLSLRGDQEALITYGIDKASGTLAEIQRIVPPGKIPWSFGIDPTGRWMLIADQGSNSVNVLAVDAKTGKLTATAESIAVPNPVTVTFYRH
jgi:6-phosphogluconolactonase